MNHESPIGDRPIVHQELSAELGTEVESPTDVMGALLQRAVASRNTEDFKSLVIDQYPAVLWGSKINELSDEDRNWAMEAIGS